MYDLTVNNSLFLSLDKDARIRNNIASDDGSEGDEEEEEPGFS